MTVNMQYDEAPPPSPEHRCFLTTLPDVVSLMVCVYQRERLQTPPAVPAVLRSPDVTVRRPPLALYAAPSQLAWPGH
jgi:hypothetical protein